MARSSKPTPRQPATKYAHLRKKLTQAKQSAAKVKRKPRP